MQERGVFLDQATMTRWAIKYSPQLEEAFHHRKRLAGRSWHMGETYIRVSSSICIAPWISRAGRLSFY